MRSCQVSLSRIRQTCMSPAGHAVPILSSRCPQNDNVLYVQTHLGYVQNRIVKFSQRESWAFGLMFRVLFLDIIYTFVGTILRSAQDSLDLISRIDSQHNFCITRIARSSSYEVNLVSHPSSTPRSSALPQSTKASVKSSFQARFIRGSCRRGGSWCEGRTTMKQYR